MKLVVDSREPQELMELLRKKEIEVVEQQLDVGDYVYVAEDPTKSFVVERKTWSDLIASFTEPKPRLWDQLQNMRMNKEQYRPILVIVGDLGDKYKIIVQRVGASRLLSGLRGIVCSIAYDFQIPSIVVENEGEFVDVMISLIKQANSPPGERPVEFHKRYKTVRENQEDMLTAVKSIGMKTAKKLLDEFKTVKNVINQDEQTLQASVGVSVGEKLYKTINGIEMEKIEKKKHGRHISRRRN